MKALFAVQSRYGPEDWLALAWFRYYDQAQLFVGAMQKRFGGWDHRIVELDSSEPASAGVSQQTTEGSSCPAETPSQSSHASSQPRLASP